MPEEKNLSGISIGYIFIGPELFSLTHRVFSKKARTGIYHMHMKSHCAMTGLVDRAQAASFFNHIKIFNAILMQLSSEGLRLFGLETEIFPFKPKISEKFAGFTETALFFTLFQISVSGAEHSCP